MQEIFYTVDFIYEVRLVGWMEVLVFVSIYFYKKSEKARERDLKREIESERGS